tara:strand:- start:214 stop:744 length:531 start_codon:yes stop_codon:yes gene_type:complete
MKKNFLFILFLFIVFLSNTNEIKAQDNIAFLNLNYVFDNSNAGKKIIKDIQNKQKKNNDAFKNLKKKFDKDKETLGAQKNVLSKEEYQKKFAKLENDLNKYNLEIKNKNQQLTKFQLDARKEFLQKLQPILEEYVKDNSIDIILKNENVLIGKTSLDITKNILDMFNSKIKKLDIK